MFCYVNIFTNFCICPQTDDDEFDHFRDEEEFEGIISESPRPYKGKPHEVPDLKIAKVRAVTFRSAP